ncbi:SIMPL domain-containing protein [Georgenia sp. 311]|uniref:SIMPL domain-containing protein n=1 Tax=Georgenia sp. 311 TaxID=2585134 RepID=UPI0011128C8A|nr:SIMPL domain-containing protein [Georgenia sp. 311]TNC17988.1 SIMPL domain-containing protein [Georgenia sp. 311]
MTDVEITVRGACRTSHPAERGTVSAHISVEGDDAARVFAAVVEHSHLARTSVVALHDPEAGPVTSWVGQDVRTWATRPWSQDGAQLPLVHHARTDLRVTFRDVVALGAWLTEMSTVEGFGVEQVEWTLTEAREEELTRTARSRAVADARSKARDYAAALGLGEVRVVALADAGMLGPHPPEEPGRLARVALAGGGPDLALVPQDVEVSCEVDARFTAGLPA